MRPHLKKKDKGRFVAIDIETGEWEIGDDEMDVCDRLESRVSDPQTLRMQIRPGDKVSIKPLPPGRKR